MNLKNEVANATQLLASRYVFLHFPRCAGSAIKKNIRMSPFRKIFTLKHHDYSFRSLNYFDKRKIIFMVVRSPYSWYYSVYSLKMSNPVKNISRGKNYIEMGDNSFEDFFYDVAIRKNGYERFARWFKPIDAYQREVYEGAEFGKGWYSLLISWYAKRIFPAKSHEQLLDNVGVNYFLRMEHLQEEFNKMLEGTEISIDLSPQHNMIGVDVTGSEKINNARDVTENYSKQMLLDLERVDSEVFEMFNYLKIEESRLFL